MKKISLFLILPFLLNAIDISQSELNSFTSQKYKVDFSTQTQENKDKLKKEYEQIVKLSNAISKDIKDEIDLKIAVNLITINIWSQKYMKDLKISDEILKELYFKEKPKTVPIYNLYNILLCDKKKAEEILAKLEKTSKEDRLKEFKKEVNKSSQDFISNKKEGNMGWVEIQQLDKDTQEKIKDKKINELVFSKVENIGYQIILIDDYKPIKDASFDESKSFLINLAKQQELLKKINSILQ